MSQEKKFAPAEATTAGSPALNISTNAAAVGSISDGFIGGIEQQMHLAFGENVARSI